MTAENQPLHARIFGSPFLWGLAATVGFFHVARMPEYRSPFILRYFDGHIINRFECAYDGETVFVAELHPAIAANPYIAFRTVATRTGELVFRWTDDRGAVREERATITVT